MILDRIVGTKKEEVVALASRTSSQQLERLIADLPACRGFEASLKQGTRKRGRMGLIAEVKKASPSKGLIRADFNPVTLAKAYEHAKTDCISVLTDVQYFQGCNDYLREVHAAVTRPLLRKDFTIDPLQVYEARAIGADAILLIAAILTRAQMKELRQLAYDLGLDVLIEVHDERELSEVMELGATMIGINNRNLRTFETSLQTTERLIRDIPTGVLVVSESGISTPSEIAELQAMGVQAVLVGEHFMRQMDPGEAITQLLGRADE